MSVAIGARSANESPHPEKSRRALIGLTIAVVLILLGYIFSRRLIYSIASGQSMTWLERDTLMSLPRLICFGLVIFAGKLSRLSSLHWRFTRGREIIAAAIAIPLIQALFLVNHPIQEFPSVRLWLLFAVTTAFVALFEEGLFRGLVFTLFRDVLGHFWAILVSAFLFAVFHGETQPLVVWPQILLFGILAGILRSAGVGLPWLVLLHWVVDVPGLLIGFQPHLDSIWAAQLVGLIALIVLYIRRPRIGSN